MSIIGILALLCAACGANSTSATTQTTSVATSVSTATPTHQKPTSTPTTGVQATAGEAVLGAGIGPFVAKFGQPTIMQPGVYDFQNHTIEVISGTDIHRSFSILDNVPDNTTWTLGQARALCLSLSPSDSKYIRHISMPARTAGGISFEQYVYVSPSLAKELPAFLFTDENGNSTTLGTIGIVLSYVPNSTTRFNSCSTEAGLRGV